jgi:hypothetical protein
LRSRGPNYYKIVEMKLSGISNVDIAENLNLSRERVRQLWTSYRIKDIKDNFRICSKCDKNFLPTYEFQSTCGCQVSPFDNCVICCQPTQFLKRKKHYPICTNIECIENLNILKIQIKELSRKKRNLVKTTITCPVCSDSHIVSLWQARRRNFKIRCRSCIEGQKRGLCSICKMPVSQVSGRCYRHRQSRKKSRRP